MKTLFNKTFWLSIFLSLATSNAVAEDIELYVGSASTTSAVKPNILFIVDTSGSMDNPMQITIPQVVSGPSTTTTTGDLIRQTFDSGVEGWSGSVSTVSQKLRLNHDVLTTQIFDFGIAKANTTVTLKFVLSVTGGWDVSGSYRDYFEVTANGTRVSRQSYNNGTTNNVETTFDLDANGKVSISLKANTTASSEYAYVDNLTIGDNSSSTPFAYNSANVYAGCHSADKIYWGAKASELACSSNTYKYQYVKVSDNKCNFLTTKLNSSGYVAGMKGVVYKDDYWIRNWNSWRPLSSWYSGRYDFDCYNDRGVHGKNSSSGKKYLANYSKGGPWRTYNKYKEINWNNVSPKNYYGGNYLNYLDCVSVGGCSSGGTTGTTTTTAGATTTVQQTVTRTRLQVAQYVINDLVSTASNINIGLMRFDSSSRGSYVVTAMDDIANNKAAFKAELNAMRPGGGTPLAESLYEAYLYYKGNAMRHGVSPKGNNYNSDSTDPLAHNSGIYQSPVEYQCQKSFVVLLTDGSPYGDTGDDNLIEALPGFKVKTGLNGCSGNCLDEMASMLFKTDMASSLATNQVVSTYTIAMGDDLRSSAINLLKNTASKGGGSYYSANDYTELLNAFTTILNEINAVNSSFVAPALSVNAFSNTTNRNELYYSLFKPERGPHWSGNLKKFKLAFENGIAKVVDKNGNAAIDPKTGYFKEDAQSYWVTSSQQNDGGEVTKGGAAAKIPANRTVYTNIVGNDLTSSSNSINKTRIAALKAVINPSLSDTEVGNIIDWVRGLDPQNERGLAPEVVARLEMADPLHSRPAIVQYGGTETSPIQTIYSTNNDGFLNAIDETTGETMWSFIPKELLPNLDDLYNDNPSVGRPYGLDGFITARIDDIGKDGTISGADKVILYIGMRRGGKNYYAVDVTNRTSPKMLWTIKGGSGDFAELGQTWSEPLVKKIKVNGTLKTVLIFGGGYDTNQDSNTVHSDDNVGRAVYIVDADTGERLWWAGPTGSGADVEIATFTNSIPASVFPVELSYGAGVSRLYTADTRGQIHRIDINPDNTGYRDLVKTAYRLAKLSDEGVTEGTRRLYYKPSAALMKGYIALVVGTGYRSKPLEVDEQNKIFMIKDEDVYESPSSIPDTIFTSDLVDTTLLPQSETESEQRADELANAKGWMFDLGTGEKVLAESLISGGVAVLTSFTPNDGTAATSCAPSTGGSKVYVIALEDSSPYKDRDGDGEKSSNSDRFVEVKSPGIPPQPTPWVGEKDSTIIVPGLDEGIKPPKSKLKEKTYWYEDKTGNNVVNQ